MIPRTLVLKLAVTLLLSAGLLTGLSVPLGPLPPLGGLLEPHGGFWTVAEGAIPVTRQTLTFPGLEAAVEVYRDQHYVPHVYARGDGDLYRAVGYLHAQDRLFQMDLQRRAATGTLSEVLGPSTLETDRFFRSIGMNWAVERTLAAADDETLGVLDAYSDGVNAYLAETGSRGLPLEFKLLNYAPRPWTPADSVAFAKLMGWSLSGSFEDLELRLFVDAYGTEAAEDLFPVNMPTEHPIIPPSPPGPPGPPSPVAPAPSDSPLAPEAAAALLAWSRAAAPFTSPLEMPGSNNWVVGPDRSATGVPLLANDPHLRLDLPSLWYQMHLVSADSLNVYGVTLAAAPVVVLGFNEAVAWGFTNVGADVVDFYVERINAANPEQYRHENRWKAFQQRVEIIPVRGQTPVTLPINITVHGPVIESHGQRVAINWTGHLPTSEIRALLNMNRAMSAATFREALTDWHVPAQNVVYADVTGTFGIAVNGLYPLRAEGCLGRLPMSGNGTCDLLGYRPMEDVPAIENPVQGFLVSANQKPTRQNDPYLGWSWADGYRADRIHEFFEADEEEGDGLMTVDEMQTLQLDHKSVAAQEFVPMLLAAYADAGSAGPSLHDKAEDAIGLLEEWDFVMDQDRVEPSVYWLWLRNFREATFRDEWDAEGLDEVRLPSVTVLERLSEDAPDSPWFDDVTTSEVEARDDVALAAFVETLDWLEAEMGTNWRWGLLHRIQLRHLTDLDALSSFLLPRSGGSFTVDVAHGSFDGNRLLVTTGASWRLVAALGTPVQAYGIHPGGQSGNPLSPHYQDLFPLWMDGMYQELALPEEEAFQSAEPEGRMY